MDRPLDNAKHEKFAQLVAVKEANPTTCYKACGYKAEGHSAEAAASRLMRNDEVATRIAFLRKKTADSFDIKRSDLAKHLWMAIVTPASHIDKDSPLSQEYTEEFIAGGTRGKLKRGNAPSGNETTGDLILRRRVKGMGKVESARLLCEMLGWKEPDRVEIEAGPITLDTIKEIAGRVRGQSPLLLSKMQDAGKPTRSRNTTPQGVEKAATARFRPLSRRS